ncbi:CRISPR-associated helicase Cas3' [Calidifontibacillus erzurumensis]|uniref:CRISPR-associated helicase Cas3 n=1 Tax=Calidifontibacillus erzurumensis TaxID=2741433 RepID=A0A8J8KCG4_9BACI|nr:CRISPR-associated helicase Cas3' [Calidifontibacillus erzurumensis]NSL53034.1 CRISPR-associated helicase Cas3' [Calidifontibacillus erzurumensis]
MEFLSHKNPNKYLPDHLNEVANFIKKMIMDAPILEKDRCILIKLATIIGLTHDYGKFTLFFQHYLQTGDQEQNTHQHSFISAFFTSFIIRKLFNFNDGWQKYAPLIGYFVVLHHHGDLRAVQQDVIDSFDYFENNRFPDSNLEKRVNIMKKQIEDQKNYSKYIENEYNSLFIKHGFQQNIAIEEFLNGWEEYIELLDDLLFQWKTEEKDETVKEKVYFYTLILYSALIDSDKHSAANLAFAQRKRIESHLVDRYRKENYNLKETSGVNGWRNEIYNTVMNTNSNVNLHEQNLFTLTSPTGSGKTLLSFSLALKWREEIFKKEKYYPRIIYALPFTSIIDQNEKVLRNILAQIEDYKISESNYLVKHHHLAEIIYKEENKEKPIRDSMLLVESWESEVIVTTFIQLFYSIIGYKNRWLKKFHNIAGSIIILDEVQNLPIEYWPLIQYTLNSLAELFNCKILLLTATQPLIFDKEQAVELLKDDKGNNPEVYFKQMNRVTLMLKSREGYQIDEWIDLFKSEFEEGNNYLAVFNTIKSSIDVYKNIKSWINEMQLNYEVIYLSTNIVPKERKQRIEKIRNDIEEGKQVILISTQVIEAGVDLDFDIVYRDLGPIDSIIQVAGRCNRNGRKKRGYVYVTPIKREKVFESSIVYKKLHTEIALEVLPDHPIDEPQFYHLINNYFNNVTKRKNQDDSNHIWNAMKALIFNDIYGNLGKVAISNFKLIDDKPLYVDVFVEIDDEANKIWEEYETKVRNETDFDRRYEADLRLKNKIKPYIVSAPIKLVKGLASDEMKMPLYLPNYLLTQYYALDIGVIRSAEDVEAWVM